MRIEYSESGSVLIHLETTEDRIIFNAVHGIAANGTMTFDRIDSSTLACRVKNEIMPQVYHTISSDQNQEIINAIKDRQKLLAVKMLKEFTGLGLKESKEAIDLFYDQNQGLVERLIQQS